MSLDCSNHRHVAGLDDRAFRHRRRDAQSLYAANGGSGWVPRAGSDYDWHFGRVAMGACGRHLIACWMELVCGRSNASSERAELVWECPRAAGRALCVSASKAPRRKAPIRPDHRLLQARTSPRNASTIPTMFSVSRPQYCSSSSDAHALIAASNLLLELDKMGQFTI